ncbi:MAG TPA: hypothetical protein VEF89_16515 [Solirubrobacteraceae bacterium]|nr:hypothetical protein [Solirubrobacteraceae bacterium]
MDVSHQTVRLGPGRHPRPGKVVCVMELASMLAGERFGDRPVSVCPVIGSILRAYNDNVDDRRRQDLYRFAADAVDTRRDYRVQRRRAEAALGWARDRYADPARATPDPEGARDEIGYYVVGSLIRRGQKRGRWSDDAHASMIGLLDELIDIGRDTAPEPAAGALVARPELDALVDDPAVAEAAFELVIADFDEDGAAPLVGDVLEHVAQPVEHRGGGQQLLLAERLECRTEARVPLSAPAFHQSPPAVGEGGQDDPAIAIGPRPLDQPGRAESFEHLGDARRTQVRSARQLADRHLRLLAKAEQQAVLRVGELARSAGLASAHPSQRGHRSLERSRDLLGGVALLALAYGVAKRR